TPEAANLPLVRRLRHPGGWGPGRTSKHPNYHIRAPMEPAELATTHETENEADPAFERTTSKGWEGVCEALRDTVGHDAFQRWFRSARWAGCEDGVASVAVPGEIHQVWVETNYLPELTMAVGAAFDEVREVRVIV